MASPCALLLGIGDGSTGLTPDALAISDGEGELSALLRRYAQTHNSELTLTANLCRYRHHWEGITYVR